MYLVADAESREYALKVMNASTPDTVKEIERELKLLKIIWQNSMSALLWRAASMSWMQGQRLLQRVPG